MTALPFALLVLLTFQNRCDAQIYRTRLEDCHGSAMQSSQTYPTQNDTSLGRTRDPCLDTSDCCGAEDGNRVGDGVIESKQPTYCMDSSLLLIAFGIVAFSFLLRIVVVSTENVLASPCNILL